MLSQDTLIVKIEKNFGAEEEKSIILLTRNICMCALQMIMQSAK